MAVVHWLEDPNRQRKPGHEHINLPRMSAETILRLVQWRNEMLGVKRTLYEESLIAEEQRSVS